MGRVERDDDAAATFLRRTHHEQGSRAKSEELPIRLPQRERHHRTSGRMRSRDDEIGVLADRCADEDRKSTRLNSSHVKISYAVFCLKKKKTKKHTREELNYNE